MTCNCQHEEVCIKLHQAKMAELFGRRLDIDGTKCPHRLPEEGIHGLKCSHSKTHTANGVIMCNDCDAALSDEGWIPHP